MLGKIILVILLATAISVVLVNQSSFVSAILEDAMDPDARPGEFLERSASDVPGNNVTLDETANRTGG